jgi:hypothetical protein
VNLDRCRVVLRPRSVSEVLDLALRVLFGTDPGLYLRLAGWFLLPCLAICLLLRHAAGWEWGPVWAVALVLGSAVQGVFTVAAGRLVFTEHLAPGEVARHCWRRFGAYVGAWLLSRALLALGAALAMFVIPPLWIWTRLAYVHEASLLEEASPGEAIKRASRFVASRGSSTLLLVSWFVVAHLAVIGMFEAIGNFGLLEFVLQLGRPFGSLEDGGSPFALAGYFASIPYVATGRFLAYVDQRTRLDGWDIQLRFFAIAAREQGPAGGPAVEDAA